MYWLIVVGGLKAGVKIGKNGNWYCVLRNHRKDYDTMESGVEFTASNRYRRTVNE